MSLFLKQQLYSHTQLGCIQSDCKKIADELMGDRHEHFDEDKLKITTNPYNMTELWLSYES